MPVSEGQKKRNRKILRYSVLILLAVAQSLYVSYKDKRVK